MFPCPELPPLDQGTIRLSSQDLDRRTNSRADWVIVGERQKQVRCIGNGIKLMNSKNWSRWDVYQQYASVSTDIYLLQWSLYFKTMQIGNLGLNQVDLYDQASPKIKGCKIEGADCGSLHTNFKCTDRSMSFLAKFSCPCLLPYNDCTIAIHE